VAAASTVPAPSVSDAAPLEKRSRKPRNANASSKAKEEGAKEGGAFALPAKLSPLKDVAAASASKDKA